MTRGRLAPLMSSNRSDWETPPQLFEALHREFRFTLDAAADERNHKLPVWLGPGSPLGYEDALLVHWDVAGRPAVAWLNPPYGYRIGLWVAKAYEEAQSANATVVALLPARTDTRWWRHYVMEAEEIRLLPGRLRFVGAPHPAPFPSCVAVWPCGGRSSREPRVFVWQWRPKEAGRRQTAVGQRGYVVSVCEVSSDAAPRVEQRQRESRTQGEGGQADAYPHR